MLRLVTTLLAASMLLSGGSHLIRPLTFDDQADQAVWSWRTSGAAEIWRDGFVPLGDLTSMPPEVSEKVQQDEEFGWIVAGPLPATPAESQIRWDDGSTMRVPVIGARKALRAISPWPEEYTFPKGEAYELTGATFTTMRLKTVRGMATVPAWRLSFSNLPGPVHRVAVDQDAIGTVRAAVGEQDPVEERVADYELLDDRTLLITYGYGTCGSKPLAVRSRVLEQPDVVVLGIVVPHQGGGICLGVGRSGKDVVKLGEPLRDRVVLDAGSRLPVQCARTPDACRVEPR
ncbi:hypothetical protein GCM10022419_063110 [Nonomuraea rosea]|uniref:Uncharacterized protein n=1 Tax=Nonomuraea rosea TaxID=638574 RepID=A0ABP6Y0P2_9ACTN